jgi:hypothetical protein
MYNLLVKLMIISALFQFGWTFSDFQNCHTKECASKIEKASKNILRINWKPISVFPEESKRFR